MSRRSLILIGGGGHCKACIDVIEATDEYNITGILDVAAKVGTSISGYPVIGTDDDIAEMPVDAWFLITIGQIKSPVLRQRIFSRLKETGRTLATVIAPSAILANRCKIGPGTIIMHRAVVNTDVSIGGNCIINTGAIVEHDSTLGDEVHLSTQSVVNGGCRIGNGTFIGSGAVIVQGITVTASCVIGAGAVVIKDITTAGTYVGNPCYKIH